MVIGMVMLVVMVMLTSQKASSSPGVAPRSWRATTTLLQSSRAATSSPSSVRGVKKALVDSILEEVVNCSQTSSISPLNYIPS